MSQTFTTPIYALYQENTIVNYYARYIDAQKAARAILKQHALTQQYQVLQPKMELQPNHVYLSINHDSTYQFLMTGVYGQVSPITEDEYAHRMINPLIRHIPVTTPLSTHIEEIKVK